MSWLRKTDDGAFEKAELILGGIIPTVLIVVGTIGNLLCILCLLRRQQRRLRSTYVYLIFLFSADTLSLYQWNLNYVVMQFNGGWQLSNSSLFFCRSIAFLSFYTLHSSALFLTLVTVDKTLRLWSRRYRTHMTKRRHALIVSTSVLISLFLLDGFLFSLGVRDAHTAEVQCYFTFDTKLLTFYVEIYPWIHLVLMYIVPFIITIVGIVLVAIKLSNRRVNTRPAHQKQRLLFMLIGMCIVYVILTLPNRLCFSVFLSRIINHRYSDTVLLASNTLLYTRNATNIFFLYVSSATFRKQLAKFYHTCRCQQWQSNRIVPIYHLP